MGDNVAEICINAVSATGLAFDGSLHGDGYLAATGASNQTNWTAFGAYGWRGSDYSGALNNARTSDRQTINYFTAIYGSDVILSTNGIRLVRTAP